MYACIHVYGTALILPLSSAQVCPATFSARRPCYLSSCGHFQNLGTLHQDVCACFVRCILGNWLVFTCLSQGDLMWSLSNSNIFQLFLVLRCVKSSQFCGLWRLRERSDTRLRVRWNRIAMLSPSSASVSQHFWMKWKMMKILLSSVFY